MSKESNLAKTIGARLVRCKNTTRVARFLLQLAKQMLSMIVRIQNEKLRTLHTASIGASLGSQHELSSELMSHAETALYEAKISGEFRFPFKQRAYDPSVVSEYQIEMGFIASAERKRKSNAGAIEVQRSIEIKWAEALILAPLVSTGGGCYGTIPNAVIIKNEHSI